MKERIIENCEYRFDFKCPLTWESLELTENRDVRFCKSCIRNVYQCKTKEDFIYHSKAGHCISIQPFDDDPLDNIDRSERLMGFPAPPR